MSRLSIIHIERDDVDEFISHLENANIMYTDIGIFYNINPNLRAYHLWLSNEQELLIKLKFNIRCIHVEL